MKNYSETSETGTIKEKNKDNGFNVITRGAPIIFMVHGLAFFLRPF